MEKGKELFEAELEKLQAENKKLRDALRFYASGDSWNLKEYFDSKDNENWELTGGKLARSVLRKVEQS